MTEEALLFDDPEDLGAQALAADLREYNAPTRKGMA